MKRKAIFLGVIIVAFVVGLLFEKFREERRFKKTIEKLQRNNLDLKEVDKFDELVTHLFSKLSEMKSNINLLKVDNEKMKQKLTNFEKQYTIFLNSLIQGEYISKQNIVEQTSSSTVILEGISNETVDKLKEDIENAIEQKEFMRVILLLKKLVKYGRDYYEFIAQTSNKIETILPTEPIGTIQLMNIEKEWEAVEFIDFYKWLIENEKSSTHQARFALIKLVNILGEKVEPYLMEKLKTLRDRENKAIRKEILTFLLGSKQFEKELIEIAKDSSEDRTLRSNIIMSYANSFSPEVTAMYESLRINEADEHLKNLVNSIYDARVTGAKGYLVLYTGNNIFEPGDFIIKVNNNGVPNRGRSSYPPYLSDDGSIRLENITLTIIRKGITIIKTLTPEQLTTPMTVVGIYLGYR